MYKLICQKPAHFLSTQMALVSTFFQMFIVLLMYNFKLGKKCMFVGIFQILIGEEVRVGGNYLRKNRYVGLLIKATRALIIFMYVLIKVLSM